MIKKTAWVWALGIGTLAGWAMGSATPKHPRLTVLGTIPHSGYSEGLTFYEGKLWHALPKKIARINPQNGVVEKTFSPATGYSESLVFLKGRLFNVSYETNGLYSVDAHQTSSNTLPFKQVGTVPEKHAWGITAVGNLLVVTGNYSSWLYFLHPDTGKVVRRVKTSITDVEDLAFDGKSLWTSSFTQDPGHLYRVDPTTGKTLSLYSLPDPEACPIIDGVAFDGTHLWVTGKHCPVIYKIKKPE